MHRIEKTAVAEVLQYGPTEGSWLVREQIVEVMAAEGTRVDALDITVTTGGQQGIDLITKTLIDPGDVIICDAPTYPGAIPTFCSYEADVRQIEMDADGMRVDLLEEMIAKLEAEGRKPKFIYSIPTFQNPGGVTLSLERRRRLVEIAREKEILVVEDNPYGLLRFEGEPCPRSTASTAATSWSISALSRRSSRPASGSAGWSLPIRFARKSCSASRPPISALPP